MLFHCQHVFESGYVRGGHLGAWKLRHAALHGSSFITVPGWLKWFSFGIEYHHIHHFRTRIPGYMLRRVHDTAPEGMWDQIVTLHPRDMWRCLWLTVYDDFQGKYSTFGEVLAHHETNVE